jgi:hypothetical protein
LSGAEVAQEIMGQAGSWEAAEETNDLSISNMNRRSTTGIIFRDVIQRSFRRGNVNEPADEINNAVIRTPATGLRRLNKNSAGIVQTKDITL